MTDFCHFEIELIDEFGAKAGGIPPPVIALTAACSEENLNETSNFKLDYLRFWATGEGTNKAKTKSLKYFITLRDSFSL